MPHPSDQIDQITSLAGKFRDALERTPSNRLPYAMSKFPRAACGDTSLLLGHFLKDQGLGEFEYVLGMRGSGERRHSHAWIQQDTLIVDITADQFPEGQPPVMVTDTSVWHSTFEASSDHTADFVIFDDHKTASLGAAYAAILENISED